MEKCEAPRSRRGRVKTVAPELTPINPARTEPVERQVYRSLRQALMQGRIPPGGTMTSRSLAEALNVSTQPVRDALKRLEADGVLEGRPQSGFYLREIGQQEFTEITEIRVRLEGLAGRLAATRITPERLGLLRELNARYLDRPDTSWKLTLNHRFHFAIYLSADRPHLLATIRNLWVRAGPALHQHPYTGAPDTIVALHATMIEALAQGDGAATEAAIRADISGAADLIRPQLPHLVPLPSGETGDEADALYG
ncbi:GntR family transcriptional regulator [Pseudooceanicola algae]|uniref:Uncharacterized protein n=1 Tax=Pseudooceanicola algae TaxID=1537215 RepID=A0A418SLC1_9RHOB|nr:GntR family transcriptional regulator [Pseudooceanicola algae]QPM90858.1 hypothetical protein PSAL_021000 [Pseudooceanicola algae]